ncbi:MFS transporter [Streptomyces sp. NPDC050145]|uniref:MFS transporter n=1 Tax=Streptomyces sp. NPDC050145 TaxID=3365602 RepID=UPI0037872E37
MTEFTESVDIPRAAPPGATPRRGALIAVAAVLATVTNAVAFMMPPLLPLMQAQFGLGVAASAWIFTALTLGGGAGFVLLPRLTDVLDDRTTSLLSGGFLITGALVPAVGDSYPTLLAGSVLLGFGGAAQLLPLSFLRRHLADGAVATAVSVLIMATGSGTVLGMVGGGLTVKYLSLTSFFYILAAAFAATTVALLLIVPSSRPTSSGRIGILGTVWLIAWVTAVLLALTQGLTWSDTAIVAVLGAGVVGGVLWALVQRGSATAVFDIKLLKKPLVSPACFAAGMFGAIDAAFLLLVAYYAETPAEVGYGLGVDALGTGLLMLPFALMMFVGGKAAEKAVQKGRPATVLVIGTAVSIVGLGWLVFAHEQKWQYLVGAAFVGLGSRIGYSGAFAVPQLVVPEDKAGMAAGMAGTTMAIGFALGSAVVTTLLTLDTIPKIGLPKEYLYTAGYEVTVGLALLVLVVTLISRLRHRGELTAESAAA